MTTDDRRFPPIEELKRFHRDMISDPGKFRALYECSFGPPKVLGECNGNVHVNSGPNPRIICNVCEKPVPLRNTGRGVAILQCTRTPECTDK